MSEGLLNFLPWLGPALVFGLVALVWIGKLIGYLMKRDTRPKPKPQEPHSGGIAIRYIRKDK